jgi:hypothetical protein
MNKSLQNYTLEPYFNHDIHHNASKIEEKMNLISIQGLEWLRGPKVDTKKIYKLSKWLLYNVFSIVGT